MQTLATFSPQAALEVPETRALLLQSHLAIHDAVRRITLHGSRGLGGHPRPDSDIDLALIVDLPPPGEPAAAGALLRAVLDTTLAAWTGRVELDLAAVFDRRRCGLRCLAGDGHDFADCEQTRDCLGVFKIQRGFNGFVDARDVDCRKMQPHLVIWERPG